MSDEKRKQREFEDLYRPAEKLLLYSRPAFDIVANYSFIVDCGVRTLRYNMLYCKDTLKLPQFDPDNPYEDYDDKNKYFAATNTICYSSLWIRRLFGLAEKYYEKMLGIIKEFEEKQGYNHNKGMVYANLGIAQATQHKIDKGFANILKALDEDRGYMGKEKDPVTEIFNNLLFRQLEKTIVEERLATQISDLKGDDQVYPTANEFLNRLTDPVQRIFFEYTYAKIVENHDVWKEKPNRFSANRMIAYLQDMCLFAEDFLKRKRHTGTLGPLIQSAFPGVDLSDCSASSYDELNRKLESHSQESSKRDRALKMLLTLRNFSSHNISAGESEDFIFRRFDNVFNEILRAVFCIYQLP